jgi:hypothetical protein
MGKRIVKKGSPEWYQLKGITPSEEDPLDRIDVSGLNDKPKEFGEGGITDAVAGAIANPKTSTGAAAQNWAQGASFGLSDELGGALAGGVEGAKAIGQKLGLIDEEKYDADPLDPPNTEPMAKDQRSVLKRVLDEYRKQRDAGREDLQVSAQEHPAIAAGAGLVGGVMSPSLPGMGVTKGAKGLGLVKDMAKSGAVAGAAYGAGKSNADLTQGDVGGVLKDTGEQALLGGVMGGVLAIPLAASQPLLKKLAERRAIKALDPYQAEMDALARQSPKGQPDLKARELGRRLLEMNDNSGGRMLRAGDTSGDLALKLARETEDTGLMQGETLGRIQDEIDRSVPAATTAWASPTIGKSGPALDKPVPSSQVFLQQIANKMRDEADDALRNGRFEDSTALLREADNVEKQMAARIANGESPNMSLVEGEAQKRIWDKAIKPQDFSRVGSPGVEANKALRKAGKEAVEAGVEHWAGPDELEAFKSLKNRYGQLATMRDIAAKGAVRDLRNNAISLGDQQLAQVGASAGGDTPESLQLAALLAIANRLGRRRGASTMAVGLDKLAEGDAADATLTGLQSLTSDEDKRRRLEEKIRSLLGQ